MREGSARSGALVLEWPSEEPQPGAWLIETASGAMYVCAYDTDESRGVVLRIDPVTGRLGRWPWHGAVSLRTADGQPGVFVENGPVRVRAPMRVFTHGRDAWHDTSRIVWITSLGERALAQVEAMAGELSSEILTDTASA